jgi:hypothetical protein
MTNLLSPLRSFFILLGLLIGLAAIGPAERSLGLAVRWVYLHGAWVWTALIAFTLAAGLGVIGLLARRPGLQRWSRSLGLAGVFFWVTYLPISLWTMRLNWNGLFLQEPRWRVGVDFAIVGLCFQLAVLITQNSKLASGLNAIYFLALTYSLLGAEQVMHPPSPIASSGSRLIQAFFLGILGIALLAGWQLTRWLQRTVTEGHETRG